VIELALTFILAGIVKGVTGMGLPTVAMGVLGLLIPPAQAAALIIIPSLVTNVWQFMAGPDLRALLLRTWPMLLATAVTTLPAAALLTGGLAEHAATALGSVLIVYALVGLANVRLSVPRRREFWLAPLAGVVTGILTGATGVFVIPAGPYLQAIGLEKEELIQALGLSFTVSTVALAAGLAGHGAFHAGAAGASLLCTAPTLAGVFAGQWIRSKIDPVTFRRLFFLVLLLLGVDLVGRSLF
jgi:uncharacterized membrane protein YfcA